MKALLKIKGILRGWSHQKSGSKIRTSGQGLVRHSESRTEGESSPEEEEKQNVLSSSASMLGLLNKQAQRTGQRRQGLRKNCWFGHGKFTRIPMGQFS